MVGGEESGGVSREGENGGGGGCRREGRGEWGWV